MKKASEVSMQALRENMKLAPLGEVKLNEEIAFSMEIPLQILFDQFTTMISKNDFKGIA